MNKIKASIIIPAYNSAKTIKKCLDSLFKNNLRNMEIIIVDDGSEDETVKIASRYPIRVFRRKHAGQTSSMNFGARRAKGEILVFLDSDCVPTKNWLKNLTKPFKDPEIGAALAKYECIDKKSKPSLWKFMLMEYMLRDRRYIDFAIAYSLAVRKKLFQNIGGYNKEYKNPSGMDSELGYEIIKRGFKILYVKNAHVYHHFPSSFMKEIKKQRVHAKWRVLLASKYKKFHDKQTGMEPGIKIFLQALLLISIFYLPFSAFPFLLLLLLSVLANFRQGVWIVGKTKKLEDFGVIFFQFFITFAWILGIIDGLVYVLKRGRTL